MRSVRVLGLAAVLLAAEGCSLKKMTIRQTAGLLPEGTVAFEMESDYEFARDALPGQIKFLEGLHRNDPSNSQLSVMLAQSYSSYAFVFLEEEAQLLEAKDFDASERTVARARHFYRRARDFGLAELKRRKGWDAAMAAGVGDEGIAQLRQHLKTYGEKDVPLLFFTAYAWGSYVNMSRDDIEAIADAPRADTLMERVLELDESYYNAGPHLYFAMLNAAKPEALGGKPDVALKHFEAASKLTGGKFLLTEALWGRYYGVQTQNRELYLAKLKAVLDAPDDLDPRQALANVLAKRKAARYLKDVDEYF